MVKPIGERLRHGMKIGLRGRQGNAVNLLAAACKTTGRDPTPLLAELIAGDLEHLLEDSKRESGEFMIQVRP